jgi:hypothetical protein
MRAVQFEVNDPARERSRHVRSSLQRAGPNGVRPQPLQLTARRLMGPGRMPLVSALIAEQVIGAARRGLGDRDHRSTSLRRTRQGSHPQAPASATTMVVLPDKSLMSSSSCASTQR